MDGNFLIEASGKVISILSFLLSIYLYINHIYSSIRLKFLRLISGNVIVQLIGLSIFFLAVFFALQYFLHYEEQGELFERMTSYKYDVNEDTIIIKILYLLGVAFFSGLLVTVLTNGFRNQINKLESGDCRFNLWHHIIIFGYNEIAMGILADSLQKDSASKRIIAIIVDNNVKEVREKINGEFGPHKNILVFHAHGLNVNDIKSFYPWQADKIHIVGTADKEINSDLRKLKLLKTISDSHTKELTRIDIDIYIDTPSTTMFVNELKTIPSEEHSNTNINVINVTERWVRRIVIDSDNKWPQYKIARRNSPIMDFDSSEQTHIIIFGMNETGEVFSTTAAKVCHFPNFITKGIKTKFTIIDNDFSKNCGLLSGQYSEFLKHCEYEIKTIGDNNEFISCKHHKPEKDLTDIQLEFIQSQFDNEALRQYLFSICRKIATTLSVVICGDNETENYELAFNLPKSFYDNNIPIWLYTKADYMLSDYLENTMYRNIIPWGMINSKSTNCLTEETNAKLISCCYALYDQTKYDNLTWEMINNYWSITPYKNRVYCLYYISWGYVVFRSMFDKIISSSEMPILTKVNHMQWLTTQMLAGLRSVEQFNGNTASINDSRSIQRFYQLSNFIEPYDSLPDFIKRFHQHFIQVVSDIINEIISVH